MMPLQQGTSIDTIQGNIAELMAKYERTGRIGNTIPRSKEHAQQIAVAIANQRAGKTKDGK